MNKKFKKIFRNFLLMLIFNKKYRRKLRKILNKRDYEKELKFINSLKGKKQLQELKKKYPRVLTTTETVEKIIKNKVSIVRYGDGELNIVQCKKRYGMPYQEKDIKLEKRLNEILNNDKENVLVCIPTFDYGQSENYKKLIENSPEKYWERYWLNNRKVIKSFNNNIYGNAFISRSQTFYDGNLNMMKKIWEQKEVVFVYGEKGRFKDDKRLFGNVKNSEEILIPSHDAFNSYDLMLKNCLKISNKKLFLIAGGPTATVLAYDLALNGYQALDIGHLPNSYQEFLGEIKNPESLLKYEDIN